MKLIHVRVLIIAFLLIFFYSCAKEISVSKANEIIEEYSALAKKVIVDKIIKEEDFSSEFEKILSNHGFSTNDWSVYFTKNADDVLEKLEKSLKKNIGELNAHYFMEGFTKELKKKEN